MRPNLTKAIAQIADLRARISFEIVDEITASNHGLLAPHIGKEGATYLVATQF